MQTKEKTKTIGERMAARQAEAEQKARALLWSDADPDEVAAVALAGGLTPEKVDKLAVEIGAAKEKLQAAIAADKSMPKLTEAMQTATEQARKAAAKLEAAQAADDAAREAKVAAEEGLRVAGVARDAGARLLGDGIIPPEVAPPFLVEIVDRWTEQEAAHKRASRIQSLKRREIPWREDRIKGLARELKDQKAQDPKKENQTIGGGGFVDMHTALEGRLKSERKALKDAKAELAKLEEQAAA
jgi:hypothetical protein